MNFNLIEKPWIRVTDNQCRMKEVSLSDALIHAHRFRALAGESPAQDAAMLRLLIAIAYTVFYRADADGQVSLLQDEEEALERWEKIWRCGQFPTEPIETYLEKWHDRFDLFDEERPFYQVPEAKIGTHNTAAKLNGAILQSDNKLRIFSNRTETTSKSLSYAEAARWVVYLQGYDDSGFKKKTDEGKSNSRLKTDGPLCWLGKLGLLYTVGENLFETIWLNAVFLRDGNELYGEPEPCWELIRPRIAEYTQIPAPNNLSGLFTLQGRRILLECTNNKVVGFNEYCGDFLDQKDAFAEPMTVWKPIRKKSDIIGYCPRLHTFSRQLWRDFSSFAVQTAENRLPGVVLWLEKLQDEGCLEADRSSRFSAVSVEYKNGSSVTDTVSDSLSFHADLLSKAGEAWRERIEAQIRFTDKLAEAVGRLAGELAIAAGKRETDNKKTIPPHRMNAAETAKAQFYFHVDAAFRQWLLLPKVGQGIDETEALCTQWKETAKLVARTQGQELVAEAGEAAFRGRWVKIDEERNGAMIHYSSAEAYNHFISTVQNTK